MNKVHLELCMEVSLLAKNCLNTENAISRLRGNRLNKNRFYDSLKVKYKYADIYMYTSWVSINQLALLDEGTLSDMVDRFKANLKALKAIRADLIAYNNFLSIG